jgi:hypothetical protein
LFQKLITHALNFYVLPQNVTFKFDEKDFQAEEIEGSVKKLRAEALKVYVDATILTPEVARQIMEDDGDLKHEYLEMMTEPDVTPEGEIEDEGREVDTPEVEGQSAPALLSEETPPNQQGQKFNPYHDPHSGEFTTGGTVGGSGGEVDVTAISEGIRKATQENPARLTHGDTGKIGFWLDQDGKAYVYNDFNKIPANKKHDLVSVHSHAAIGWDKPPGGSGGRIDSYYSRLDPLNSGDVKVLQSHVKGGYSRTMAVIHANGALEVLHVPKTVEGQFLRIKPKQMQVLDPPYSERAEWSKRGITEQEGYRGLLRSFAQENGLVYQTDLSWKSIEYEQVAQQLQKELDDPGYWERLAARLEKEYEEEGAKLLADMGERIGKRLAREIRDGG